MIKQQDTQKEIVEHSKRSLIVAFFSWLKAFSILYLIYSIGYFFYWTSKGGWGGFQGIVFFGITLLLLLVIFLSSSVFNLVNRSIDGIPVNKYDISIKTLIIFGIIGYVSTFHGLIWVLIQKISPVELVFILSIMALFSILIYLVSNRRSGNTKKTSYYLLYAFKVVVFFVAILSFALYSYFFYALNLRKIVNSAISSFRSSSVEIPVSVGHNSHQKTEPKTTNKPIKKPEDIGLQKIKYNYYTDGEFVYNSKNIINSADLNSFEVLDISYAKDKNNVYYYGNIFEGVDIETFESLGYRYAKDKDHIYNRMSVGLYSSNTGESSDFGLDPASFSALSSRYVKDDDQVIFYDMFETNQFYEIVGVDSNSFTIINELYSKDENNIYFGYLVSEIVDSDTFEVYEDDNNNYYSRDKYGVYYKGVKVKDVDIATFEVISCQKVTGCYAKDKNYVYEEGKILEDEDPQTFTIKI